MWRRKSLRPEALAAILTLALGQAAEGQTGYRAEQFDSARFRHIVQTDIQTAIAGRERRERIAVGGVLILRAGPHTGADIRLEAWYDSLHVRRSGPEGTVEPDTDGLLGGRYRGALAPQGRYAVEARPFVPDGVAEAVDLSGTMEDFLPLLPPRPLGIEERWDGGAAFEVRRLSDSVAGDTLLRFEVWRTRTADAVTPSGDTAAIPATQTTREEERFTWHPRLGLLRRTRVITVETDIPGGGTVPQPVRSRVAQRVVIERLRAAAAE